MTYFFTLHNKWRHASWCVLACMVLMLLPCCMKKTHLSDLENRDGIIVKNGEGVFTGKAWSSDDKTLCIECEMERIKSLSFFYDNGKMAGKIIAKGYNLFDSDVDEEYYDINGKPISVKEINNTREAMKVFQKMDVYMREINKSK